MVRAAKSVLVAILSVFYGIGKFIYGTGWVVEQFILGIFRFTLLPLFRFLRLCTPKNIFAFICGVGDRVIKVAVWIYEHTIKFVSWAAHSVVSDFCWWAPGFSLAAIIGAAIFFQYNAIALEVSVDGSIVSYVGNEQDFESAVTQVEQDLYKTLGENYCMYTAPEYRYVIVRKNQMAHEENLYAQAYRAVTEEIGHHYGLYVDGKLVAATEKRETIELMLNELKAPYETDAEDERIEFVSNVEVRTGLFAPDTLVNKAELRALFEGSTDPQYYIIEDDDLLSDIAKKTGLSKQMLHHLNPEMDERKLVPGKKLLISAPDIYLGVKVVRTVTYDEEINYNTTRIKDSSLYVNQTKVKTPGQKGSRTVTAEITYIDGVKSATNIISSVVTKEPVTRELYVGTKDYPNSFSSLAGTGAFIRPISGGFTSCGYGGYPGHKGMDLTMSGAYGRAIYASASGTVISAGWSGGYGYCVKIRHSNGYVTLYAHCSSLLVSAGQTVTQGQQIARIGSTGNSTGPHLHFEIIINGRQVNPAGYI